MSIRKDNYAKADTGSGYVFGKVTQVRKNGITINVNGDDLTVDPSKVTKLTAAEFKAATTTAPLVGPVQPSTVTTVEKPTEKEPTATATSVTKPKTSKAPRAGSKTEAALNIFNKHFGSKTRSEIISLFMSEVNLTKGGASTYYANFKNKHETTA